MGGRNAFVGCTGFGNGPVVVRGSVFVECSWFRQWPVVEGNAVIVGFTECCEYERPVAR